MSPGLGPVTHCTEVVVAVETTQAIPSMIMEFSAPTAEKPVPVKVTVVPPVTVPNLGVMAVSNGVEGPEKATWLATAST